MSANIRRQACAAGDAAHHGETLLVYSPSKGRGIGIFLGYRLVGIHAATGRGRITSPIVAFEPLSMTAETEFGRIYRLRGPANGDAAALLIHDHIRRSGLTVRDVALATVEEVAMSLAPKPQGGWH